MDICFVSMPFPNLERPSLALGSLSAACRRAGFSSDTLYECMRYAERIGLDRYLSVSREVFNQIGEWVFRCAAFPDFSTDTDALFELLESDICKTAFTHSVNVGGIDSALPRDCLEEMQKDAVAFVDEAAERVLDKAPKFAACTSQFQQHNASLALLRRIKQLSPETVTMLGGTNCVSTIGRVTCRNAPWVDFVFSGEAEMSLPRTMALAHDFGTAVPVDALPIGVLTAARLEADPSCSLSIVENLDGIEPPDHDAYFEQWQQFAHNRMSIPQITFETSRGCWWYQRSGGCKFCSMTPNTEKFRAKSPERAEKEILGLAERYPTPLLFPTDDILDDRYYDTLLPALKARRRPDVFMFFEIKSNLKEAHIQALAEAGIIWVQPGIESLSDGALKNMNKGISAIHQVAFLKFCLENGVRTMWHILAGFPEDRSAWYREILDLVPLISHLQPPDAIIRLHMDRFSRYHREPKAHGVRLKPHPIYFHAFPFTPEEMADFAFFFIDDAEREIDPDLSDIIAALEVAVTEWNCRFDVDGPAPARAHLSLVDDKEAIVLTDTRPVATAASHTLTGLDAAIYRAARTPISLRKLSRLPAFDEAAPSEIEARVDAMCTAKILLRISGRILALAAYDKGLRLPSLSQVIEG